MLLRIPRQVRWSQGSIISVLKISSKDQFLIAGTLTRHELIFSTELELKAHEAIDEEDYLGPNYLTSEYI